jgi:hypothetical protein
MGGGGGYGDVGLVGNGEGDGDVGGDEMLRDIEMWECRWRYSL